MQPITYKQYAVVFNTTHNGERIQAQATSPSDKFTIVYYGYTDKIILKRIKKQCAFRSANI